MAILARKESYTDGRQVDPIATYDKYLLQLYCWSVSTFIREAENQEQSTMDFLKSHGTTNYRNLLLLSCLHLFVAQNVPSVRVPTAPQNAPTVRVPTAPVTTISSQAPSPSGGVALPSVVVAPAPTAKPPSPIVVPTPTTTNSTIRPTTFQPTTTYPPTITAFPTVSAFPTGSQAPTSEKCNICGTGAISFNDLLVLPTGNITCAEAADFGMRGMLTSSNCLFLQEFIVEDNLCACIRSANMTSPTAAPTEKYDPCFICGDGNIVSISDGKLPLPNSTEEPFHCSFIQTAGEVGLLAPDLCAAYAELAQNASDPCGCVPDPSTPSPAGTEAPTSLYPPCYVCGNEMERVTALDTVVALPDDVRKTLEDDIDPSIFTCEFVEERGLNSNSFERLVCAYLQMAVSDVCACQVVAPISVPVPVPTASLPSPSTPVTPASSAKADSAKIGMILLQLSSLFIGLLQYHW